MPYRHLLYNRRHGAPPQPQHQGTQQIPSHPEQYFPSPQELAQYQWSEMDYSAYHAQSGHGPAMNAEQAYPSKRQALSIDTAHNPGEVYYQNPNFAASPNHPFQMSSENYYLSQGSIYSAMTSSSHVDSMLEEDRFSLQSNSRKPSATSDVELSIEGDPGHGVPNTSSVNFASLAPIHECTPQIPIAQTTSPPMIARPESSLSPTRENTKLLPPRPRASRQRTATIKEASELTAQEQRKTRIRAAQRNDSKAKSNTSSDVDSFGTAQSSKVRARQAHSLVERKYRENLNAKILQLHQALQQTEFGLRSGYGRTKTQQSLSEEEEDEEGAEKSTYTSKFKKSDVLSEAMNYVNATELEMRHMTDEIRQLNARVQALEKLVKCEDCKLMKQMDFLKINRKV